MLETAAFSLLIATLWLSMHGYHGLTGDGQIYAFQAMAKLRPYLAADLYLQNTSQDQFTVFSAPYAWCIDLFGLERAARFLTLVFTLAFLGASWGLVRVISSRNAAWAALAFLLITSGSYGGSGVFKIVEPFLTARLPAQVLVATSIYCQLRGMRWIAVSLAIVALLIHPLIALPGLLVLLCLLLPLRIAVIGTIGGVLAVLVASIVAASARGAPLPLSVMDPPWLEVVRERSQFLFLRLWAAHDWDVNLRPFFCLAFSAMTLPDPRIRKLCAGCALVGAAGLTVALIGDCIGPMALLIQGQAWRWVWLAVLVSALLLPYTAWQVAKDRQCGPFCAILLLLSWTFPGICAVPCAALALIIWLMRPSMGIRAARFFLWGSIALSIAVGTWAVVRSIEISASASMGLKPSTLISIHDISALKVPAVLFAGLTAMVLRTVRNAWGVILLVSLLAGLSALLAPTAFNQAHHLASDGRIEEFADWEKAIPKSSTVLVAPARDVGTFVWFTLGRLNYLSLDQSAGVAFSRRTALEIRRRSSVLLPLMDPDWKILSRLSSGSKAGHPVESALHPLTARSLSSICADPVLGFVISPDKVNFPALTHRQAGPWLNWNLYDCSKVRLTPATL